MRDSGFKNKSKSYNKPTSIVIFGGTGDLARTKLLPALLNLYATGRLPDRFHIIGLSRKDFTVEEYRAYVENVIAEKSHRHTALVVRDFCSHFSHVSGNFAETDTYEKIREALNKYDDSIKQCTNKLFYLAVPPGLYEVIFDHLHASNIMSLCDGVDSWSRLLVEKPFGKDLKNAQALENKLCTLFKDEQIYRIDHYLAKDAIENIIAIRFANAVLADSWNGQAIESIHIKLLETKDVSSRGHFYDSIGTLRDVGQNHMLQIFSLLTMPPTDIYDAQAIRHARAVALRALADCLPEFILRAQYQGYGTTTGVAEDSDTETYFKLSFTLDDDAWRGTLFTFEAGKALDQYNNEAIVTFRPRNLCNCKSRHGSHEHRNVLRMQFAPEQLMSISMWTKAPGFNFSLREQALTLVGIEGEESASPEAYEKVLFDCIMGDQTCFVSGEEVRLAWQFITPILDKFNELPLYKYLPGSSGPKHPNL